VVRRRGFQFSDNALTAASSAVDDVGIEQAHMFVLRMGRVVGRLQARFARKTTATPFIGSWPNVSFAKSAKPSAPFLKSTGWVAA
jgi:hypothetical protein